MEVRIDEITSSEQETRDLGIEVATLYHLIQERSLPLQAL